MTASLTYSGSLYTLGERSKAVSQPTALRVLNQGALRIVGVAEPKWPVLTGDSKRSLHVTLNAQGVVISAIGYAPFIVSKGVHPWSAYILIPFEQFVVYEAPNAIGRAVIQALAAGSQVGTRLG